jgi:hypothetical protein
MGRRADGRPAGRAGRGDADAVAQVDAPGALVNNAA